jgi:hypothetical protein
MVTRADCELCGETICIDVTPGFRSGVKSLSVKNSMHQI